jgi:PLP dependent protein
MSVDKRTAEIRASLERVQDRIERAAQSAGRNPVDVRLIVVTKAQSLEVTRATILAGADILGENYPEEALPKIEALREEGQVEWHMIGHLQSRKARIVAEHFSMLHSLDSIKLAEKLERLLEERDRRLPVLLEVNVGDEESKYGWPANEKTKWEELLPVIESMQGLPHLQICGMMTMPPLSEEPEESRLYFQRLRMLRDYLSEQFPGENFEELSMGTSVDFETAIQEGSTFVRIGQAIVGPRPGW